MRTTGGLEKLKNGIARKMKSLLLFLYTFFGWTILSSVCAGNCQSCYMCFPILATLPILILASTKNKAKGSLMKVLGFGKVKQRVRSKRAQ